MKHILPALLLVLVSLHAHAQSGPKVDPTLEAVGALSASQIYSQYVFIGVLADAYANKVYSPAQVQQMMAETIDLMGGVSDKLGVLAKDTSITQDDRVFITRVRSVIGLLQTQAKALITFSRDSRQDNGIAFEAARKSSWAAIADILGIGSKEKSPQKGTTNPRKN
jgi:hypothetical protein